jgi:hypothetical protein
MSAVWAPSEDAASSAEPEQARSKEEERKMTESFMTVLLPTSTHNMPSNIGAKSLFSLM